MVDRCLFEARLFDVLSVPNDLRTHLGSRFVGPEVENVLCALERLIQWRIA